MKLTQWWQTDLGGLFLKDEKAVLDETLISLPGIHLLQVGVGTYPDLVARSTVPHKWLLSDQLIRHPSVGTLVGQPEALPLPAESLHILLLLHTLESSLDPRQILREVDRVLLPEGYLVISQFNRASLWQLARRVPDHLPQISWRETHQWLHTNGYNKLKERSFGYRLPLATMRWQHRFAFVEPLGRFLWPWCGAGTLRLYQKRRFTLTPLKSRWKQPKVVSNKGLIRPTPRSVSERSSSDVERTEF